MKPVSTTTPASGSSTQPTLSNLFIIPPSADADVEVRPINAQREETMVGLSFTVLKGKNKLLVNLSKNHSFAVIIGSSNYDNNLLLLKELYP